MDRTLLNSNNFNWLSSPAFLDADGEVPLDPQMGTGHLNAKRAVEQFATGEYDPNGAAVPKIGWDFDTTDQSTDVNKYVINSQLQSGTYFSATLAWDRTLAWFNKYLR